MPWWNGSKQEYEHTRPLDRRAFIATAGAGLAAASIHARSAATVKHRAFPDRARNVIFMVADGLSAGTIAIADLMSRRRDGKATHWVSLWDKPGVRRASATTASADSPVTDSSAGASAWSIGKHINNGSVNVLPDGSEAEPLLVTAKAGGKAVGCVTTTRITHATPAAFYSVCQSRDFEDQIAAQLSGRGLDVALGGGAKYFEKLRFDTPDAPRVVRSRAELTRARAEEDRRPLIGLLADDHIPFLLDRTGETMSLAEMSTAAISILSKSSDGFVLQIEGGRVDHAAHNNDAASLVAEHLDFDAAIGAVLEFIQDRDDTLLIVTSDHGTANPGLTFYGKGAITRLDRLAAVKMSTERMLAEIKRGQGGLAQRLKDGIAMATGIELPAPEISMLESVATGKRVSPFAEANTVTTVLGAILADYLGVAFLSPNHTSDMVEVTALGPGADTLPKRIDNIDLHALMMGAMAIRRD